MVLITLLLSVSIAHAGFRAPACQNMSPTELKLCAEGLMSDAAGLAGPMSVAAPVLGMVRGEGLDVLTKVVMKFSKGHPGAMKVTADILQTAGDDAVLLFKKLDSQGISGQKLWDLFEACGQDLGILMERVSRSDIPAALLRN